MDFPLALSQNRLNTAQMLAYAGPAIPLRVLLLQLVVYIPPLYATEVGLELAAVGLVFFLARSWDALIDPLVGNLSDRTRSRWGRRKPWLAIAAPLLMVFTWLFCLPPDSAGIAYLGFSAFAFYVAMTAFDIPFLSWGSELSRDYSERTRIVGFREGAGMLGTVLATGLPLLVFAGTEPSLREIMTVFVVIVLVLVPVTTLLCLRFTPDGQFEDRGRRHLRGALSEVWTNRPYVRLLAGVFCFWLAGSVFNAMVLFLVTSLLELPNSSFLWFVFAQYIAGVVCLPLAVMAGNRFGKHRALVVSTVAFFALGLLFLVIAPGQFSHALVLFVLMGAVTSFIWVMPPALVGDAVEFGMFKGGGDDAAIYMSLYYFVQKMAMAVGVGIALPLAGLLGFDPAQGQADLGGLSFVGLWLPLLLVLPGIGLLFNYPITAQRHAIVRRWLYRRESRFKPEG